MEVHLFVLRPCPVYGRMPQLSVQQEPNKKYRAVLQCKPFLARGPHLRRIVQGATTGEQAIQHAFESWNAGVTRKNAEGVNNDGYDF